MWKTALLNKIEVIYQIRDIILDLEHLSFQFDQLSDSSTIIDITNPYVILFCIFWANFSIYYILVFMHSKFSPSSPLMGLSQ